MEEKNIMNASGDTTISIDYIGGDAALDTITIDLSDTINLGSSITSPCTITVPSYSSGYTTTSIGSNCYNWSNTGYNFTGISDATVNIDADGVNIKEGGDLKIGNASLKEFMIKMEQRLAILVPDPAKLEKFEALKKAYEHYKTMEKLCFDEPDKEEN